MRTPLAAALLVVCLAPATAWAQSGNSDVQGFGGITFGTSSSTFGNSISSTLGGRVGIGLTDNIQAIGEGGWIGDIKPPLYDLLYFTPADLRVSAWYGEAGVRFLTSSHSAIRPYGEATAGFARLSTGLSGVNGTAGEIVDAGLNFLNRTEPMLGAGAGVLVQGGPISLDLGYRYKKILAANSVAGALNFGSDFSVNQFRIGVGVRF
jgi:opacity protein-like surface antigen